jgi:hypothetical protein
MRRVRVRSADGFTLHFLLFYHQENLMSIELRKWFQLTIAAISILLSAVCWFSIRSYIPALDVGAQIAVSALLTLLIAAIPGFFQLFRIFVPLLVVKLWPEMQGD